MARRHRDAVPARGVPYTRHEARGSPLERLVEAGPLRLAQRGQTGRHGHGIPGERARLVDGALGRDQSHQVRTTTVCPHGHSASDDLAERGEIGPHLKALLSAAGGDPKSGHDLVEDQQSAVAIAQRAQRGMELRRGSNEPGIPDVRLDDHRGQRVALPPKQCVDGGSVIERQRDGQSGEYRGHARAIGQAEGRNAAPRLHQEAVPVTVVAALELEDRVAARRRPREPHGRHGRFGPRAHAAQHLDGRHPAPHVLGQFHFGLARRAIAPPPRGSRRARPGARAPGSRGPTNRRNRGTFVHRRR